MVWETWIQNPGNFWVGLKPFGKSKGVVASSLDSKTQGLDTLKQQECRKWVQGGAKIWSERSVSRLFTRMLSGLPLRTSTRNLIANDIGPKVSQNFRP